MTSYQPATDADSTADSVTSTPRSDHHPFHSDTNPSIHQRVRFMCSFGGKIFPRPHDNQLRYVGDTRIVAVNRHTTFSALSSKLSKLSGTPEFSIKYQLPNEDLDALITVTSDEDVENMMEEYDRLVQTQRSAKLRLFLFANDVSSTSRASSISSLLDGSAKREQWFLDALNGGSNSGLERGRSEASSIVSEVPDYLFGLDNSDDPPRESKLKYPGSPVPVISTPFSSTSSALAPSNIDVIPDLPPVKTKPDNPVPVLETPGERGESMVSKQTGYIGSPMWNYPGPAVQPMPVYYVPGPVQPGNIPVQQVQFRAPFMQPYPLAPGQVPVGYAQPGIRQVYGGGVRQVAAMDQYADGANPVYYGVRNPGLVPTYSGVVVSGGEEIQGFGTEGK